MQWLKLDLTTWFLKIAFGRFDIDILKTLNDFPF